MSVQEIGKHMIVCIARLQATPSPPMSPAQISMHFMLKMMAIITQSPQKTGRYTVERHLRQICVLLWTQGVHSCGADAHV